MNAIDIPILSVIGSYALLIFPLSILLWYRIPIVSTAIIAVIRMSVQLLFVGFYLQVVFNLNNFLLNAAWLIAMVVVADVSVLRHCRLKMKRLIYPLFASILIGTAIPTLFFLGPILHRPQLLDAQYAIPIAGMILGNCLRADIIGIGGFYRSLRDNDKAFQHALAQGAKLQEACRPFMKDAFQAALAPFIATMATVGLVSLPGMMTGVILGGADPMTAIKYQIAIMIAIFTGTAITLFLAVRMTLKSSFDTYGNLDRGMFKLNP
ncbi:ABC transporter [candidate division LCP-89 bacterium B3_LCP]|uniref:ABC transporter n=1 Tax=candidate division LCP-89 bacterium B3_LCP TaxID=2012998 RepID=A0A532UW27_UNCL8|nr:MAG: ABC transporter [candidate division LCP-89 bacterium B3_LCP]